nr:hypothetical protein [Kibdelosporangium sp. MJ126-NF4]CEL17448.1 hypothetical protein [Kibdelosporangium sp. MJ126-NF4]CTQ91325.1 hypothetical protein [Kibdelosporangium sp. MJ126-NF4]
MNEGTRLRRINPAGFLLALLLFLLLPCIAVSCDKQDSGPSGRGSVEVSYNGWQLVARDPSVVMDGVFATFPAGQFVEEAEVPVGVTVIAVVIVTVMAAGVATSLARKRRVPAAITAAVLGSALLVVAEVVASAGLVSEARDAALWTSYLPETQGMDVQARAGELVGTRIGFWLTLAMLLVLLAFNAAWLIRSRRQRGHE